MPFLAFPRRSPVFERPSDRFVVLAAAEAPSTRDAGDMCVDGERRMSAGHREDDVGGLRTDTGESHQFFPRPSGRKGEDPFDLTAPLVTDCGGDGPDSRSLLTGKACVPDRS